VEIMTESSKRHSRRNLVKSLVAGTVATAIGTGNGSTSFAQDGSPTPQALRTPILQGDPISIFDSGAELPADDVTMTWLENGSGPRTDFMIAFFEKYHEAHPNITVKYDHFPIPDQQQLLSVSIQNNTLPDVFQPAPSIPGTQLVSQGLVAPLDDIIPNFAEWRSGFPANTFFEGINVFNGKTYTFPITSNQWLTEALLFNTGYMQEAGFDPIASPMSWDDFREVARKITDAGKGQYFGLIIGGQQTNTLGEIVSQFAELAGAKGGDLNWETGEYNFNRDEYAAAIELLVAINQDGSFFPGSMQLSNSAAREQFPQGVAGMMLQGQWNIPQWATRNPDFTFDVAFQPLADPKTAMRLTYGPGGANPRFVSAETKVPTVAGDVLHYLGSPEGQIAWGTVTQGSDPPLFQVAREAAASDPRMQRVNQLTEQWMVLAPSPAVRNPGVAQVNLEMRPLTPDLGELVQGLLVGQLSDAKEALQDLQDRANAELDRAIKAAQDKGAEVSRDDWIFPNWNPAEDYSAEMYQAL
jgi:multiple sugar transport system substrate-binding protein